MKFKIKEAREKIGLTQKELAQLLGIKPTTFNGYEKGLHDPKSEILKQIAIKCNTSVDFLLGITTEISKENKLNEKSDIRKQCIVNNFDLLNEQGKEKLFEYSEDLVTNNRYIETENESEYKTVLIAARSKNNDKPITVMQSTQEDLRIFDITPQSDEEL